MLSELKLIGWALGAAAVLGVFWWVFHLGQEHEQAARQEATIEQQRIDAKVGQQRVEDQARIAHDATVQADAARAGAAAADRAAAALRVRLNAFVANARAADPPASGAGEADPIGVLAEVLGRIDDAAGRYAKEADANRIAGLACERAYDSLTVTP